MNTTDVKNKLRELQKQESGSLLSEICAQALEAENENPITFLTEMLGDLGLKYSLDRNFFITYIDDIELAIESNTELAKKYIRIDQFSIDASWFAHQITLQNLLVEFNLFIENDALFE